MYPDEDIYREIMHDIGKYTGKEDCHSPRFEEYPYPQRLSRLSELLWGHTLRECGDYKKYLRLQTQLFEMNPQSKRQKDVILHSIINWMDGELESMAPAPMWENPVVLFMLCFGEDFLQRVLLTNFQSLMAPGNLPALCKEKNPIMYLITDAATRDGIEAAPIVQQMKALGVVFQYAIIPDSLISELYADVTYTLLGAGATVALHYARKIGAAFHHSYPDAVYSDKFFTEVLRLSKEHTAILGQAMRADEPMMLEALQDYRKDGVLAVPAEDLTALQLNALHQVFWPLMVNNRVDPWSYPLSHATIWEGENFLHLNCPHLNIYWLDHTVFAGYEPRFYMTLDSELDLLVKGWDFYIPRDNDDLYMGDLSEPNKNMLNDVYGVPDVFSHHMWKSIMFRDTLKFYLRGMRAKINRKIRPLHDRVMQDIEVKAEQVFLYNALMASDPYRGQKFIRERSHAGMKFI